LFVRKRGKDLSVEERKLNERERNRKHAVETRKRRKNAIQSLKDQMAAVLASQRAELLKQQPQTPATSLSAAAAALRCKALFRSYMQCRCAGESSVDTWQTLVDATTFKLVQPRPPYPYLFANATAAAATAVAAEPEQWTVVGAQGAALDAALLLQGLQSSVDAAWQAAASLNAAAAGVVIAASTAPAIEVQCCILDSDIVVSSGTLMCPWHLVISNLRTMGFTSNVTVSGLAHCCIAAGSTAAAAASTATAAAETDAYSGDRLSSVELHYDTLVSTSSFTDLTSTALCTELRSVCCIYCFMALTKASESCTIDYQLYHYVVLYCLEIVL
jgi:hypothetical protein